MNNFDFSRYKALTFDCYGTLIDWESGIVAALRPLFQRHGHEFVDEVFLSQYAKFESRAQADEYRPYRDILRDVVRNFGEELGLTLDPSDEDVLWQSLAAWPPFPDTVPALRRLAAFGPLGILSNVDDELFTSSALALEISFEWVVTAEQVGSYKPALANFRTLVERTGLEMYEILHVAQSMFHDIVPAATIGIDTIWVNRRLGLPGSGATLDCYGEPLLEVGGLGELADLLVAEG